MPSRQDRDRIIETGDRTQRNTWLRFLTSPAPYRKYRRCHPIQPAVRSMVIVVQSPATNNISLLGPTQEQPAYGTRNGPDLWAMLATPTLGAIDGLHGTGRTGSTTPGNDSIDYCHNLLNIHTTLKSCATFRNTAQEVSRTTPAICRRRVSEDAPPAFPDNDWPYRLKTLRDRPNSPLGAVLQALLKT